MPVSPEFTSRSGGSQFLKFAQTMCRIVNALSATIRARYPDRPALLAVLSAAEALCPLLPAAIQEQIAADNADVVFDPADGTQIPGQDA